MFCMGTVTPIGPTAAPWAFGVRAPGSFQAAQGLDVYLVPVSSVRVFFLWGFEDLGGLLECLVADDRLEAVEADEAFADVVVAIDAAAEFFFRVVEVPDLDALDADRLFDVLHERGILAAAEVVAGGEEVGGVEADGEALRLLHHLDDLGEVFELAAEATALAGGDLQAGDDIAFDLIVNAVEGLRDALEAFLFAFAHVGARVGDEVGDFQDDAAGEFLDEQLD